MFHWSHCDSPAGRKYGRRFHGEDRFTTAESEAPESRLPLYYELQDAQVEYMIRMRARVLLRKSEEILSERGLSAGMLGPERQDGVR